MTGLDGQAVHEVQHEGTPEQEGHIVTFYSYKGGTGRTMSLANTAWILASAGKRVLVVDWDLESPGLHRFFQPFLDPEIVESTPGVIEILTDYAHDAVHPGVDFAALIERHAKVLASAVSIEWDYFPPGGGLDFISAGRQRREYSAQVSSYEWDDFYDKWHGGQFLDALRNDMKRNYDYVLIDSRTGLSDVSEICTVNLPDTLVVCFTLSNQSIEGASALAREIDDRYHNRGIRILPVPMRIEEGEKEKADIGRALARSRFGRFPTGMTEEAARRYWGSVEIPYRPFYAFEEILAPFGDAPGLTSSMLTACERLTGVISEGEVRALAPPSRGGRAVTAEEAEKLRLRYRQHFLRRPVVPSTRVCVSYAPEDRLWAEWIQAVLRSAGLNVTMLSSGDIPGAAEENIGRIVQEVDRVIAVVSSSYLRARRSLQVLGAAAESDPSGARHLLIPVRVGEVSLISPLIDREPVDLRRMTPQQAVTALLRLFDRRPPAQGEEGRTAAPRFPGEAPAVWNVPTRNAVFTGRGILLENLRDQLVAGGSTVVLPQALYGLGGVGKTQVALEYAHRFMADYDLVWWIQAEQPGLVASALGELAAHLNIESPDNLLEPARVVRDALRRGLPYSRWLLIFDNADAPQQIERYLPGGSGHVIITSRNQSWSQTAAPLEVDVFSRAESLEHLTRRVKKLTAEDAVRIAEALGDLPIAIEQAGAWLGETGTTVEEYLSQLDGTLSGMLSMGTPANYPSPVAATWNVSFTALRRRSPASVRLLELLAFFAPEPVSLSLVRSDAMRRCLLPYDDALHERMVIGKVIQELGRFALAKVDQSGNFIEVHRLVQAVVRDQMSPELQEQTVHEVHNVLVDARPTEGDTDSPENGPRYDLIWPHLGPSRAGECDEAETRHLLIDRVRFLWQRGEYQAALELGQSLKVTWETKLGEDDRQTLQLQSQVANVLRSQGHYQQARELDKEVFDKQTKALGKNHPNTLMTAAGLAADMRALGELTEALEVERTTYDLWREGYGEDNPRTLGAANNLAVALRHVGEFHRALELDENTLQRRQAVIGHDHPFTLSSASNLARDLRELGDFRGSVRLLEENMAAHIRVLGAEHPSTMRAAKSLAAALRVAGEYARALELIKDTHNRLSRRAVAGSPDSLACTLELACTLATCQEPGQAGELSAGVMKEFAAVLGPDHPYTLAAANNLAIYRAACGDLAGAAELAADTLDRLRARMPDGHPFIAMCAINLGVVRMRQGHPESAEVLFAETAESLRGKLGPEHPDTLVCLSNLACAVQAAGRPGEAQDLRARLAAPSLRAFGEGHPDLQAIREGLLASRPLEPHPW
ncbi:FxSxx-COOH system tetratricopeptide repeat protein [Acrocarpospora catenulata]|uniref:FxSxx-COOH system tetratricopeptide repeat protein n=1 Tax=Acrocarpospora catenulata TaxID=2836182 RepID=UPI001BD95ACC|nr:FxSxx-COOH system tetratricopeptide repeat protein [Acrocarpospora catenulata]